MRRHYEIERRLSGLETARRAEDDAPKFFLNFAPVEASRVTANGRIYERGESETTEAFHERIKSDRGGAQFVIVSQVAA
jgi:hypothetical protein